MATHARAVKKIALNPNTLKHVVTAPPYRNQLEMWNCLIHENGNTVHENIRRSHKELQNILTIAVEICTPPAQLTLDELEFVCPQLLAPSCWEEYCASNSLYSLYSLSKWWLQKEPFNQSHVFFIDATAGADGIPKSRLIIKFRPRGKGSKRGTICF